MKPGMIIIGILIVVMSALIVVSARVHESPFSGTFTGDYRDAGGIHFNGVATLSHLGKAVQTGRILGSLDGARWLREHSNIWLRAEIS